MKIERCSVGVFSFFLLSITLFLPEYAESRTVTEFTAGLTASCNPRSITAGPDGNLWFTEDSANKIGRITPTGVITEFSAGLSAYSYPWGITAGPDGNLWFTVFAGIGRITPSGIITVFKTGLQEYSNPIAITAGSDGNLWFTDCGTNAIGKITTSGEITEFVINPDISYPWGITAGPDGNLWFTDCGTNAIGKITTSGVVTLFSAGLSLYSGPAEIITGPDGNLWFTENYTYGNGYGGNKIGRITPSGVITEFSPLPTSDSGPWGITSGPDGNIWFTEYKGGMIGRITPSGIITEFSIGLVNNRGPQGLVTGPDGNLWFTEYDHNAIGRFSDIREGCSANLDGSGVLNVPYLANQNAISGDLWIWANFIYEPNPSYLSLIPFKVTTLGLIDNPSSSCTPSTLYADLTIRIPDMTVSGGNDHLWVDLKYSPLLSSSGKTVFIVTNYGQVSD